MKSNVFLRNSPRGCLRSGAKGELSRLVVHTLLTDVEEVKYCMWHVLLYLSICMCPSHAPVIHARLLGYIWYPFCSVRVLDGRKVQLLVSSLNLKVDHGFKSRPRILLYTDAMLSRLELLVLIQCLLLTRHQNIDKPLEYQFPQQTQETFDLSLNNQTTSHSISISPHPSLPTPGTYLWHGGEAMHATPLWCSLCGAKHDFPLRVFDVKAFVGDVNGRV